MKNKQILSWVVATMLTLGWSLPASAFTNSDIFDSILSAHQDESRPKGMPYIANVKQVPGTYNAWTMKFRVQYKDAETRDKVVVGMPTTLRYAGNKLFIKIELADVDRRVVDRVFKDLKDTINDLKDYDGGDLEGFKSNIGHSFKSVALEGYIDVAGKKLEDVRNIIAELREVMADFYVDLYEANLDALEDYEEDVLDEKYPSINEAQTFLEVIGHGFTLNNQIKQRKTQKGQWAWKVGDTNIETLNLGEHMEEVILLNTGSGLSQYKIEKMYDELLKRAKTRFPKGAKDVKVEPHYRKSGITTMVYIYPYSKKIDGEDLREYHKKFKSHVESIADDLEKIIKPYYQAPAKKEVYTLGIEDFVALIDDGLESLPVHEAPLANGQWKFKYKGVAYIITNYKSRMELAFIYTLPRGMDLDKPSDYLDEEIDREYGSFADKYGVLGYKNSKRTLMVKMNINYGLMGSKNAKGDRIKAKYDAFTRKVAPDLQNKLKSYIGL